MKRLCLMLAFLFVAGCANGNVDSNTGEKTHLYESSIMLLDDRAVTCIVFSDGYRGGVSCDWDGAKMP